MLCGRSITYPVSHATRGSDTRSHTSERFEGACAHFPLRARDGVDDDDLDGVDDLEGVRSGSGKALGWPRVETMFGSVGGAELCECGGLSGGAFTAL